MFLKGVFCKAADILFYTHSEFSIFVEKCTPFLILPTVCLQLVPHTYSFPDMFSQEEISST